MKNKITTYALLAAVIGIWGYVIYKIIHATQEDDNISNVKKQKTIVPEDLSYYTVKKHDSLNLNFRDPIYYKDNKAINQNISTVNKSEEMNTTTNDYYTPPADPETMIQYLGFVENDKTKKKTAMIQIENEQYMLGVRETIKQVTILELKDDYIRIKDKSKTRTIFK